MSIFKKAFFRKKLLKNNSLIKNSIVAVSFFLSAFGQDAFAKDKKYVAVEPLACDLLKSIALPSDQVKCLIDRNEDVHDLKINPRQTQSLSNADKVFTLGKEMTPAMRNWEEKSQTVVFGVSAIDVENPFGDSGAFEWAGVFDLRAGNYTWSFAKVDGEYADPAQRRSPQPGIARHGRRRDCHHRGCSESVIAVPNPSYQSLRGLHAGSEATGGAAAI